MALPILHKRGDIVMMVAFDSPTIYVNFCGATSISLNLENAVSEVRVGDCEDWSLPTRVIASYGAQTVNATVNAQLARSNRDRLLRWAKDQIALPVRLYIVSAPSGEVEYIDGMGMLATLNVENIGSTDDGAVVTTTLNIRFEDGVEFINSGQSAPSAPSPFAADDWSLATGLEANQLVVNIASVPANGGSPITAIQYSANGGTWMALPGGAGTGPRTLTMPAAAASYSFRLRAVNAVGTSTPGDTKTATSGAEGAPAPTLTAPLPDLSLTVGDDDVVTDLSEHFDGATSYAVSPTGQGVSISGGMMTSSAAAERSATYTVTASNSTGQTVSDAFALVVAEATPPAPEVVWVLSDPTDSRNLNRTALLVDGASLITATCNGTEWINDADDQPITPWWLPRGVQVFADFENGRFYFDGGVKALADLIDNGDGSYLLPPVSIEHSSGAQVVVADYTSDMSAATRSGHLWGMSATPTNTTLRMEPVTSTSDSSFMRLVGNYYATSGQSISLPLTSIAGETSTFPGTGRHRQAIRLFNGQQIQHQPDNGDLRDVGPAGARVVTTIPTITRIGLGCSVAGASGAAQARIQNSALNLFVLYNRDVSAAEMEAIGRTGISPPVHHLGDSFMTLYRPQHNISKLIEDTTGGYFAMSQDAVGGTTVTQQAARFASANPKWRKSTVVIGDMGISPVVEDMITGIDQIRALLDGHDRWIYLEPAPQHVIGGASSDAWLAAVATMRDYCGDRFVETRLQAFAASDGSPEDEAEVAKGLWPLSLKKSLVDFHPSARGDDFMAVIIRNALIERGWLIGTPTSPSAA